MIEFDHMLDALAHPLIQDLKIGAFTEHDVVNLILQRSEIIRDQHRPGKVVGAWVDGDHAPALALVDKMGEELAKRAAAIILLEYLEIKDAIDVISPKSTADIGCGYALFDLFLWNDHPGKLILIDIEQSEERHFGYRETGAAYSNLKTAKKFLKDNGVKASDIICINPEKDDLSKQKTVDMAVSFISCGFHYPVGTYMDYFRDGVAEDGAVILDFRGRKAREGVGILKELGTVSMLTDAANGNAKRVMLKKG